MVERFWNWMLKINARVVFLTALFVLLLVLALEFRQGAREGDGLTISGPSLPRSVSESFGSPWKGFVLGDSKSDDPFTSAYLVAWLDLQASKKKTTPPRASPQAASSVKSKPAPKVHAPTKIHTPPKWVHVIYLGMITRTDGIRVALVREKESGRLYSVREGEPLNAVKVTRIDVDRIHVVVGDDESSETVLRVGVVGRIPKDES